MRLGGVRKSSGNARNLPGLLTGEGDDAGGFGGSTSSSPSGGPSTGTVLKSLQLPLPENDPIPLAQEFEYRGTVSTAAPGIVGIPTDNGSGTGDLKLGAGEVARIAHVWLIVAGTITVATEQLFTLLMNGTPIPGWSNRLVIPTPSNGYTQPFDAKILVPNGGIVTAQVNNVDGGAYIDGVMYDGWRWPEASGRAWNRGRGSWQ